MYMHFEVHAALLKKELLCNWVT